MFDAPADAEVAGRRLRRLLQRFIGSPLMNMLEADDDALAGMSAPPKKKKKERASPTKIGWLTTDMRVPLPTLEELENGCYLLNTLDGERFYLCTATSKLSEQLRAVGRLLGVLQRARVHVHRVTRDGSHHVVYHVACLYYLSALNYLSTPMKASRSHRRDCDHQCPRPDDLGAAAGAACGGSASAVHVRERAVLLERVQILLEHLRAAHPPRALGGAHEVGHHHLEDERVRVEGALEQRGRNACTRVASSRSISWRASTTAPSCRARRTTSAGAGRRARRPRAARGGAAHVRVVQQALPPPAGAARAPAAPATARRRRRVVHHLGAAAATGEVARRAATSRASRRPQIDDSSVCLAQHRWQSEESCEATQRRREAATRCLAAARSARSRFPRSRATRVVAARAG